MMLAPALISALCQCVGPSAIVGRVAGVIINAVNCVALRPSAHIAEKRGEVSQPFIAKCDPATAVLRIFWGRFTEAALSHRQPCPILRSRFREIATSGSVTPQLLNSDASAACCDSTAKRASKDNPFRAAHAQAAPSSSAAMRRLSARDDSPSSEYLADYVFYVWRWGFGAPALWWHEQLFYQKAVFAWQA